MCNFTRYLLRINHRRFYFELNIQWWSWKLHHLKNINVYSVAVTLLKQLCYICMRNFALYEDIRIFQEFLLKASGFDVDWILLLNTNKKWDYSGWARDWSCNRSSFDSLHVCVDDVSKDQFCTNCAANVLHVMCDVCKVSAKWKLDRVLVPTKVYSFLQLCTNCRP